MPSMMVYKLKTCLHCGREYLPTNGRQKYCVECKPWATTCASRKYVRAHPDKIKERNIAFRRKNPDYMSAYAVGYKVKNPDQWKKWVATHSDQHRATSNKWASENSERAKATARKWAEEHPEKMKEALTRSEAKHPGSHSARGKKSQAKRRSFGFVPLNKPFVGAEGHHVDNDQVIYMPKALHRSIWHRQRDNRGMAKINAVAYNFLFKQEIEEAMCR